MRHSEAGRDETTKTLICAGGEDMVNALVHEIQDMGGCAKLGGNAYNLVKNTCGQLVAAATTSTLLFTCEVTCQKLESDGKPATRNR